MKRFWDFKIKIYISNLIYLHILLYDHPPGLSFLYPINLPSNNAYTDSFLGTKHFKVSKDLQNISNYNINDFVPLSVEATYIDTRIDTPTHQMTPKN